MDTIAAVKFYLNRMVDECGVGMKVLLMDRETISIVSLVVSQTEMLQKEVYLFERIDNSRISAEPMKYLKCLVFLRPTEENIDLLRQELKSPRFGQYHIYFSNIISKTDIKLLAEADEQEVVKDVQEFYSDYMAVSPHLFSINANNCYQGFKNWNPFMLQRTTQAIISVLLSLRRRPTIRYQSNSEMSKRLAENIRQTIAREGSLFDFRKSSISHTSAVESAVPPVLLILDRKFDPISPLLNQWTYQAMLHELLTINNNRINLSEVPGVGKDLKEVVLSQEHDDFYERNVYLNYGEICSNIKELMDEFQNKSKSQKKVESIADMKSFIETYPQFKKMSGTVTKHVTLIDELFRLVSAYNLFEISEAEQELVCQSDHSESLKKIRKLISSDKVRDLDAIRLAMIYALRFEKQSNNDITGIVELLKRRGISDKQTKLVNYIIEFAGSKRQTPVSATELLSTEHVKAFTKKMIKGLKGVENIYTQHSPLIRDIIEDLSKGKLKEVQYPYLGTIQTRDKPQEIIVFIIGGTTYEESCVVYELNKTLMGVKVLLGATNVHNFKSFIEELSQASNSTFSPSFSGKSRIL